MCQNDGMRFKPLVNKFKQCFISLRLCAVAAARAGLLLLKCEPSAPPDSPAPSLSAQGDWELSGADRTSLPSSFPLLRIQIQMTLQTSRRRLIKGALIVKLILQVDGRPLTCHCPVHY